MERERYQVGFLALGLALAAVAVLLFADAATPQGEEEHILLQSTNHPPVCILSPINAVAIFEAGSAVVWIDGEPVPESGEDGWHSFADGRRFTTRPATEIPGVVGCQGPAVSWSDGVPEDAEAMRLYAVFVGGLIVSSACDRYNTVIEPIETYRCRWVWRTLIFKDGFESGDTSAWSLAVGAEP